MPPHKKNIKDCLIEETIRQIKAVGPDKLSLRKIAAECGVTHATAYKYFENKQALINVCRLYVSDRLNAYLKRAARKADEPYVGLMKAYVRYMTSHPQYHYLIHLCPLTKTANPSGTRIELDRRYTGNWDVIKDYLVRCGIREEAFLDILTLISTTINGLISLLNRKAMVYKGGDPTDLVDILILEPLNLYPKP